MRAHRHRLNCFWKRCNWISTEKLQWMINEFRGLQIFRASIGELQLGFPKFAILAMTPNQELWINSRTLLAASLCRCSLLTHWGLTRVWALHQGILIDPPDGHGRSSLSQHAFWAAALTAWVTKFVSRPTCKLISAMQICKANLSNGSIRPLAHFSDRSCVESGHALLRLEAELWV